MKKKILSLLTTLAMLCCFTCIAPITEKIYASTDVSNLYPVDSTYNFIKKVEGFDPECFWDVAQWTIGYGNKCPYKHESNGTKYKQKGGHTITESDARELFDNKLSGYVNTLKSNCKGLSMNQNQFDALLSATYNHGNVAPNGCKSCGYKSMPLVKYLQGGLTEAQAREQYYVWCINVGTSTEKGLRNRRKEEADLFFSDPEPNEKLPSNLNISSNKTCIFTGETVTFSYTVENSNDSVIGIDKDGSRYDTIGITGTSGNITYTFKEAGVYCVIVVGSNPYGATHCEKGIWIEVIPKTTNIITNNPVTEAVTTTSITTQLPITITTSSTTTIKPVTTTMQTEITVLKPVKANADLNGDGIINIADIVEFQKIALEKYNEILYIVDLNGDGVMNVFDMIILKRVVLAKS